jgi:hypothetical protein
LKIIKTARWIIALTCITWHAGAGELKSYAELGLMASEEEFSQFIRSPIHLRIIQDAPEAVMYRVAVVHPAADGAESMTPIGGVISSRTISGFRS